MSQLLTPTDYVGEPSQQTVSPERAEQVVGSMFKGLVNRHEVRELMKASVDWTGKILLPEQCTKDFAPIHQTLWTKLITSASSKLEEYVKFAIGLPRGHAKTQLLKMLCVIIITETDRRFILVVGNTATLARRFINDVMGMLTTDNFKAIYGDISEGTVKDSENERKFMFNGRMVIMVPMGIGSSVRGANVDNWRPDVIICDDMQSLDDSQSPDIEVPHRQLQWFIGTLLLARSYTRCLVIYLGNMYPDRHIGPPEAGVYTCILRNLDLDPDWISIVTGAILSNGTALWPGVHPLKALIADLRQATRMGQQHIWYAEVMNSPEGASNMLFNEELVPEYPYKDTDYAVGKYLMIDPSLGSKTSDAQLVAEFHIYDDLGPALRRIEIIQKAAPELVFAVLEWALTHNIPLIASENHAYQGSLLQWFSFWCEQYGIEGIHFVGINRGGISKVQGIIGNFKDVMAGKVHLHPSVRAMYYKQAREYRPTKQKNVDDALDITDYGRRIYLQYPELTAVTMEGQITASGIEDSTARPSNSFNAATYNFRQ